ncbi:anthranilate synthase component 1 [Anaerotignum neopropionicum]|uniref:Anthranilate synthase component 1 n=1 Tax=Anaerotignum neopropionicum TaxID=36847 RepID=A0A136WDL2_9FIRM|nr:anthranilate synthase component I [Anaerotignum neopropionicum]KXL52590.1 anthranilate synthase component 1 [Anaerotignum neopropionicum]
MSIKPNAETISKLAESYDIIPISKEIYADVITPISLLRRISNGYQRFFLLESIEGGEKWGRYSFLGFDPIMRITCKNGTVTLERDGEQSQIDEEPFAALRGLMHEYQAPRLLDMPPFAGGLVGYFAYSMIGYCEPTLKLSESEMDDYDFMLFDKVIAYDHLKQKILIIVNMKTDNVLENYGKAVSDIENLSAFITDSMPTQKVYAKSVPHFTSNFTQEEFCKAVDTVREYIYDGDIFQAVISRRFETEYHDSLLNAYRVLRTTNPSPYMVFMQCDDSQIISASPETLVKLRNGKLSTFPIAGSRPRGLNEEEDMILERELIADEKELSEHNMLVDLARNDIGKIAKPLSVYVSEYMKVIRYSKIMHICSEVNGELKEDLDAYDAISAILPAGTLSGAPKVRACEIIEETERCPRGVYGGALGYIDFTGNLDTCIGIRMAVKKNNRVYVQAGAGIVADSVGETEFLESENKAKAVINAIVNAKEANDL